MHKWLLKVPLFDRYDEKASSLLSFKDGDERMRKRYAEIKEAGDKIHTLLEVRLIHIVVSARTL